VTAQRGDVAAEVRCTCGSGVWGTCDQCDAEAWVNHRCPFPCDDVTCENGSLCIGCLTGRPCPMHNRDDYGDDEWDDEYDPADDVVTRVPLARYL
jgi:hypothetical protein